MTANNDLKVSPLKKLLGENLTPLSGQRSSLEQ